jgi:hypothetical protein
MPLDLKSYLSARLQDVPREWVRSRDVVAAAAQARVLPLFADWSGYYGLREDASVVFVPYDEPRAGPPETDVRLRTRMLFLGARHYSELRELVPQRGDSDETCPGCGGSGILAETVRLGITSIVCMCGGLGWLPSAP